MADPFDTLGIEPRFTLEMSAIEQRHRDLSKALHPDKFIGAPAAERRLALGRAIEVNSAFRVVRDPIKRACAILERAGIPVGETSEPPASQEWLMEMMDAREELADARRSRDAAKAAKLGDAMQLREERELARLGLMLDMSGGDRAKMKEALPLLGELRYIRRFLDEVSSILEEEL